MIDLSFVPANQQINVDCRIYSPSNFHRDIFVMLVLQCCSAERTKQARADPLYLEEDTERQRREWRKTIWLPLNICTLIFEDVKFLRILCRNKFLLNLMNYKFCWESLLIYSLTILPWKKKLVWHRFVLLRNSYSEVPNRRADRNKQAGLEKNSIMSAFLLCKLICKRAGWNFLFITWKIVSRVERKF